jgi:hypothetical protein
MSAIDWLSRYVFDKRQLRENDRYSAFMPRDPYPNVLSVFNITELNEETIWSIGEGVNANKSIKGRYDFQWTVVSTHEDALLNQLTLNADGIGHPNHCNIENYPGDIESNTLVALALAKTSNLIKP